MPCDSAAQAVDVIAKVHELWPHHVQIAVPMDQASEIRDWCVERHGQGGLKLALTDSLEKKLAILDPNRGWVETGAEFCFRDPNAAFEFKMTWYGAKVTRA